MKQFLLLLLSLPLLSFEGEKVYQCVSMYKIVGGSPHEFSQVEQDNSRFELIFDKDLNRIKTSVGMIYNATKSSSKGTLYVNKSVVNGRTLYYKLKIANNSGLYKSVAVTGYGNLVNEYVMCQQVQKGKENKGE